MAAGLRLDLRQTQQLVMTPQLQQAIKLLQMSNLELAEFVAREVEQNPLLEIRRGDDAEPLAPEASDTPEPPATADPVAADLRVTADGDHGLADETFDNGAENLHDGATADAAPPMAGGTMRVNGRAHDTDGLPAIEERLAGRPSLREHLRAQLGQARAPSPVPQIARYLVEELDEHGYLRADLSAIAYGLGVTPADAESALSLLQGCDPTGVGARDLAECLRLQLAEQGRLDPAMLALTENLGLVAQGDWKQLRQVCGVDAEDISEMIRELRRLDPRPCAGFEAVEPETLIPDVLMRRTAWGGWHLELNPETLPRVLIDRTYAAAIGPASAETRRYLSDCQASAGWLVRSLDQRARTILKIATEIVRQQQRFFDIGVTGLKPLNLRTVAEAVGMHESTASRVTSNKYIATERGILELKFFFTNAIGTGGDGEVSAEAVRHRVRALVNAEDPAAILSDDTIVELLAAEGIEIARRTVAKYRKLLNIPSSVERRRHKSIGGTAPLAGA